MVDRPTVLDTADMVVVPKEPVGKQRRYKLSDDDWSPWYGQSALLPDKFANQYEDRPVYASPHPTAWEDVKAYVVELEEDNQRLRRLFDQQWKRTREAGELWRKAHPGNDDVSPDLGELVRWLMSRADTAEARIRELEARLEAAEKVIAHQGEVLKPLADAVFNDNGNMSVDVPFVDAEQCIKAYFAERATVKWMEGRDAKS